MSGHALDVAFRRAVIGVRRAMTHLLVISPATFEECLEELISAYVGISAGSGMSDVRRLWNSLDRVMRLLEIESAYPPELTIRGISVPVIRALKDILELKSLAREPLGTVGQSRIVEASIKKKNTLSQDTARNQNKIVDILRDRPHLRVAEIQRLVGNVSERTVRRLLSTMIQEGIVLRDSIDGKTTTFALK